LSGSSIWVVPARTVRIDRDTGLIVADGRVSESTISKLTDLDPAVSLKRMDVAAVRLGGVKVVAYGDARIIGNDGIRVSPDLWRGVGEHPARARINDKNIVIAGVNHALPPRAVQMSLTEIRRLTGVTSGASWLFADPSDPKQWATRAAALHVNVTSDPSSVSTAESDAVVYLLQGSFSRFDPFTFRTKFSAVTLNAGMSTLFGYVARAVLLLGVALAIMSAVIGVRERREEVALFSVTGLISSFVLLLGTEACILQVLAFSCGGVIATAILRIVLAGEFRPEIIVQALAFVAIYMPALIVATTIVPGQTIAATTPMEAIRRDG
jgi:hypothetical protein